jgi:hypothetical protein
LDEEGGGKKPAHAGPVTGDKDGGKEPTFTAKALGEEGGKNQTFTSAAVGEEGGKIDAGGVVRAALNDAGMGNMHMDESDEE